MKEEDTPTGAGTGAGAAVVGDDRAHLQFLLNLERIDQAIKAESDLEKMLWSIVRATFAMFDCDRAWLLYPCDPDAPSFRVPVEVCRPEYPGANIRDLEVPMAPGMAREMRDALSGAGPVARIVGTDRSVNSETVEQFGVLSQIFVAIFPKVGMPWLLGMHQCSSPRVWTEEERRLFNEIGRRMADGLSSVLFLRDLQQSEELYRATFEHAATGIAHMALDGRWLRVNQKLCDILGYSTEEMLQKAREDITHPDDLEAESEYVQRVVAGERPAPFADLRFLHKDGSVVWVDLTVSVVREVQDGPGYFIAVVEDATSRKNAEQERAGLESQLLHSQKMESVGRLAGGVAHDFNNILLAIIGHAELALAWVEPGQPLHSDLQEILKSGHRATELTRQLLAFARKQAASPKVVDLNDKVTNTLAMIRRLIGENIHLAWVPGVNLWPVKIDPVQIDQVLANLCVNARDAVDGIGEITIETSNVSFDDAFCAGQTGYLPGQYIQLAVSDDGVGMEEEVLESVFEPFFTTKGQGKGTGLGLATVYGIVTQNGGFISVRSAPGTGTSFELYLPRYQGESEEGVAEASPQNGLGGPETILLVEDEASILELCRRKLTGLGYNVLAAASPGEAIRLSEGHVGEIDLLVTDVVLPEMNGRELCTRLLVKRPSLKRLFMSGHTADVIVHHGVVEEGVNFLQKPFTLQGFSAKVREILQR